MTLVLIYPSTKTAPTKIWVTISYNTKEARPISQRKDLNLETQANSGLQKTYLKRG